MERTAHQQEPVVIKKYANRRLYDTETSAYITLEDLCERVKKGTDFVVIDAKTGHDLTRQVLTQIIFEQESKGSQILPTDFLRSVIQFYDGNKMQEVLQQYLDASMKTFMSNRERMQGLVEKTMGGFSPFKPMDANPLEELTRHNMALFEKAIGTMFNPFGNMFGTGRDEEEAEEDAKAKQAKR